jgi:nitrogen PTS system EIIA component
MDLANIFRADDVFVGVSCSNKNQLLQLLCDKVSQAIDIDPAHLIDVIRKRENLGSTGIGRGIAVPHSAVSTAIGLRGFILRISKPIDFEAIDGAPVDLIFLLVFEEKRRTEYLKVLATIARKAHSETTLAALRSASTPEALHAVFVAAEEEPIAQ